MKKGITTDELNQTKKIHCPHDTQSPTAALPLSFCLPKPRLQLWPTNLPNYILATPFFPPIPHSRPATASLPP